MASEGTVLFLAFLNQKAHIVKQNEQPPLSSNIKEIGDEILKPWVGGVIELLEHAIVHINEASDFDRRIAFISIDNAVELSIRTFLALPKRVRKHDVPSRKELQDAENSFPMYLDLIEKYATDKLIAFELSDIEWYHRLRNQLYHNGTGLTVEKSKVEAYYEISKNLFELLFDETLPPQQDITYVTAIGSFMQKWSKFERDFRLKLPPKDGLAYYWKRDFLGSIDEDLVPIFNEVMSFRNNVVHGEYTPTKDEFNKMNLLIEQLKVRIFQEVKG